MKILFVGIGDFVACNDPDAQIKTMALGSCIAVNMYDPKNKIGGMAHIALPDSKINLEHALKKPGYFADTAIPKLAQKMKDLGSTFNHSEIIVKITGGASILDNNNCFNIGDRNIIAVKTILQKYGFKIHSQDTGKNISRTVTLELTTGKVIISCPIKGIWEI